MHVFFLRPGSFCAPWPSVPSSKQFFQSFLSRHICSKFWGTIFLYGGLPLVFQDLKMWQLKWTLLSIYQALNVFGVCVCVCPFLRYSPYISYSCIFKEFSLFITREFLCCVIHVLKFLMFIFKFSWLNDCVVLFLGQTWLILPDLCQASTSSWWGVWRLVGLG